MQDSVVGPKLLYIERSNARASAKDEVESGAEANTQYIAASNFQKVLAQHGHELWAVIQDGTHTPLLDISSTRT